MDMDSQISSNLTENQNFDYEEALNELATLRLHYEEENNQGKKVNIYLKMIQLIKQCEVFLQDTENNIKTLKEIGDENIDQNDIVNIYNKICYFESLIKEQNALNINEICQLVNEFNWYQKKINEFNSNKTLIVKHLDKNNLNTLS